MLDENLPTYTFRPSSENPLHTILYFTQNGSDAAPEFLLRRPAPSAAPNRYAVGLMDAQNSAIVFGEVLLEPEWSQPTLSAAEVRAQGQGQGAGAAVPVMPDAFAVSLYNPDQAVVVKRNQGGWKAADSWEFEMPEQTFKQPSASRVDADAVQAPDLVPKAMFRWKRDGRLSKDMTCYLCGRSVDGRKNKEPDITVALFRGGRTETSITVYEPNMARVDVQDRKGLEVALLLSADVIRDLYLSPRQDPFNTAGSGPVRPGSRGRRRTNSRPSASPPVAAMSGALNNAPPSPPPAAATSSPSRAHPQATSPGGRDPRTQAEIDAETRRLQAMVAEEERQARERRDAEEQQRIKQMLQQEEEESRRRREAEIEAETERLRREYGVPDQAPPSQAAPAGSTSPALPPRPAQGAGLFAPQQPARPQSMGPVQMNNWNQFAEPPTQALPPQQQQQQQPPNGGGGSSTSSGRKKLGKLLQGPYTGPAAATVSGFFGGSSSNNRAEEERRKKVQKKRSVHF